MQIAVCATRQVKEMTIQYTLRFAVQITFCPVATVPFCAE